MGQAWLKGGQGRHCPGWAAPAVGSLVPSLMNLAAVYYAQGQYTDAARLYQRALGLQEQVLGPDDPQLIPVLEAKAAVHCKLHPVRSLLPWSQRIRWQPVPGAFKSAKSMSCSRTSRGGHATHASPLVIDHRENQRQR